MAPPDAPGADPLVAAALAARDRAYAPYSAFQVGAALLAEGGRIHAAGNVENAAYPQGQCAEASAIGVMVAAGDRRVLECVVLGPGDALCAPCGGCRQRLFEFGGPDLVVRLCDGTGRERHRTTLGVLLPLAFGPASLAAPR
jgi:cytidine deaminase